MKTSRGTHPPEPSPSRDDSHLPAGWRKLATRLRGTRLYQITQPAGTIYWEAIVKMHDGLVRRRFAAELHARVWLAAATDRTPSVTPFNLEEVHGRFRAACVAAGGIRPVRPA